MTTLPPAPKQMVMGLISQGYRRTKIRNILNARGYASVNNTDYGLMLKEYKTGKVSLKKFRSRGVRKYIRDFKRVRRKKKPIDDITPKKGLYYAVVIHYEGEFEIKYYPFKFKKKSSYTYKFNSPMDEVSAREEYYSRISTDFKLEMESQEAVNYRVVKVIFLRYYGK